MGEIESIALAQKNIDMVNTRLKMAEQIALAGKYRDCLTWVYRARFRNIEMTRLALGSGPVRQSCAEACAYASDFNRILIDHLVTIWTDHDEDGKIEEALWFCDSAIALWQESGLTEVRREVIEVFRTLKQRLHKSE